jgi:HEAT repeat protein
LRLLSDRRQPLRWTTGLAASPRLCGEYNRTPKEFPVVVIRKGRKFVIATGLCVGVILIVFLFFWKETVITYHLQRLRREEGYLPKIIVEPEGSLAKAAVLRFLVSETGQTALADLYLRESYGGTMKSFQGQVNGLTEFLVMSMAVDVRNQEWKVRGPCVSAVGTTGPYRSEEDWLNPPPRSKHDVPWATILAAEELLPLHHSPVIRLPRYPGIAFELVEGEPDLFPERKPRATPSSAAPSSTAPRTAGRLFLYIRREPKAPVEVLCARLKSADPAVRLDAALDLAAAGSAAKMAVGELIAALSDKEAKIPAAAGVALSRVGSDAVPALAEAIRTGDSKVRSVGIQALEEQGMAALPAVPALIECFSDKDKDVRRSATRPFRNFGPEGKAAVPGLIILLEDKEDQVRSSAARALSAIGPEAQGAIPAPKVDKR